MNRIEEEWHQLKTHEIAGRMFEDEYDLAIAYSGWKHAVNKVDTHWNVLSLILASYFNTRAKVTADKLSTFTASSYHSPFRAASKNRWPARFWHDRTSAVSTSSGG